MVITYSKSKDRPGNVANTARDQLNRENGYSLSPFAPENLVSREGFGSPVPRYMPILSACPLQTNSGRGKREAHISWSMVTCKMAAPVTRTTLSTTDPVPAESRQ